MANNRQHVEKLQRQQTALSQFGVYAFRAELKAVLTEAARLCAEGLNVPFCKVLRYRAEQNDLIVEAGIGWQSDVISKSISQADESSPGGRAFKMKDPVITRDLRASRHDFTLPPIYADHSIFSSVNVVIQGTGDRPYGVLEVDSPKVDAFDDQDVMFIQGFANVLAEAVASAEQIAQLRANIEHKDALARELQHRVRNNLQVVYRMLEKEAKQTHDMGAKRGFTSVARRIIILGHVYEHLLGLGLTQTVNFADYLTSLCDTLKDFFTAQYPKISLIVQAESTDVNVDTATALGLIVNELVTNSYEHAFNEKDNGLIEITFKHGSGSTLILKDSGPGFIENPDSTRNGLALVRGLVKQIGGSVTVQADHNTIWTITLPN